MYGCFWLFQICVSFFLCYQEMAGKKYSSASCFTFYLRLYVREAGRDPAQIGLEGMVNSREGQPDDWVRQTEAWRDLGATHITFSTSGRGFTSVSEHIEALRSYKDSVTS